MKKKVKKLVPELRFSEFEGDWKKLSIKKIASVSSGGTPSRTEPTYWNGDIPWVTTSEIGKSEIFDSTEKITKKGLENSSAKLFPKDTILIAMYGQGKTRGQVSVLKINATTNQACAAILLKNNSSSKFVYYFLFNEYERLRRLSNDGSQKNLSAGLIKQYKIPLTSIEEQEKITKFLDSVTLRISQLRRKQELLETYKKGVMQKIFSQQIRFKQDDGKPFPDWKKKKLSDIASRKVKKNLDKSITRVLTNSAVQGVVDQQDYFDKDIANANNLGGYYIIEKGDYVYNPRISVSAPVEPIHKNKIGLGVMSPLYSVFRFNSEADAFFEQYFKTSFWHKYMCSVANYGARHDRMNITTSDFMALPLPYPVLKEQEKIANFLTVIDKKIEAVGLQIEKLEEFK